MEILPLAHITHWYHAVLYLIPVLAVLIAIVVSALRARQIEGGEARDPGEGSGNEPPPPAG